MTLAEAQALRAAWYAAELAVATGQSYTIGDRTLTRVDAALIAARLAHYDRVVEQLTAGAPRGPRTMFVMPRDL